MSANNSPAKIFVMRARAGDYSVDEFSCVASAIQYRDLPVDEPDEGSPFFRVDQFDAVFRTAEAVLFFQESLLEAVQELVDELAAVETLDAEETFTIVPTV